jgi:hypothetical protein
MDIHSFQEDISMKNKLILFIFLGIFLISIGSVNALYVRDLFDSDGSYPSSGSYDTFTGGRITMNVDAILMNYTRQSGVTATRALVLHNNGTVLANVSWTGDTAFFNNTVVILLKDQSYYVVVHSSGATYNTKYQISNSYPQERTNFNVTGGCNGATTFPTTSDVMQNIIYITTKVYSSPSVILNSPINYFNSSSKTINFNASAIEYDSDLIINNVSLYIDGVLNETSTSHVNGTYLFTKILSEGNHNWSILAFNNYSLSNQSVSRIFAVDLTSPTIIISSPYNGTNFNYSYLGQNMTLNTTATDSRLDRCIYNHNGTNISFSCSSGVLTTAYFNLSNYSSITVYANDTAGNTISNTTTWTYKIFQNSITYQSSSYESSTEDLLVNISLGESKTITGILVYNGTSYTATKSGSSREYLFLKSLSIPIAGNNTFYWSFNYGGEIINSTIFNQNVSVITLTNCTSGTFFLNLSFYDEKTKNILSESNNISAKVNILYYVDDIKINKTFNNSFTTNNISICFTPVNKVIVSLGEIEYEDATHVKRRYYFIYDTFSNSTTSIKLYDLLSSQSTSFIVYIYDSESLPVEGAYIVLKKKFVETGEFEIVEMSRADDIGLGILHFVSEDDRYKIYYYDSNGNLLYTTNEFSAVCIDSLCSITNTIPYSILLDPFSELTGDPNFSYVISSSNESIIIVYNSLDGIGYNVLMEVDAMSIINDSIRICSETQLSSSSGILTCNISASGYDTHLVKLWVNGKLEVSRYISEENEEYKEYGIEGIIYAILIILVLTLLFAWNWILCLVGCVMGVIVSIWMHFIPGTIATAAYLIVVIIYVIISGGDK